MPSTLKMLTVWLLLGTAVFLGFQALERQQRQTDFSVAADGRITLQRGPDGHYHWPGTVNGVAVDFLVDTGATRSALPAGLAAAAGLVAEGTVQSQTAGGLATGQWARADLVLAGGVQALRLPVTVLPGLHAPLLGMDLLGRMDWRQDGATLTLRPRPPGR